MNLDPTLDRIRKEIEGHARGYGLDFFDTQYELLDFDEMNTVASRGGFPNRYPHWRFGMEYEQLSKSYAYGLHTIYEMVVNTDPCYAYLLEGNNMVDQKIVMAHVFGHSDFFKNNLWFSKTNRKMMDVMANHATKVRKYIDTYGHETVDSFLDVCLSLDNLIDPDSLFIERGTTPARLGQGQDDVPIVVKKIATEHEYLDGYLNPSDDLEKKRVRLERERADRKKRIPESPQKDVLLFLIEHAPRLEDWQRDILWMIREEAYYFAPQAQTKIMNEGWATYWHEKIMTEKVLDDSGVIDFADHHSGTVAPHPGHINPYKLGFELWKDIEHRWNTGRFGKAYDDCDDAEERWTWDLKLGLGREKIFEARRIHNDITFIDEFFTEEFCREHKFFRYQHSPEAGLYYVVDTNWKRIKENILASHTNRGEPFIFVVDGNYHNSGELLLEHRHEGVDLRRDYMLDTLENLWKIWSRPVHMRAIIDGKQSEFSFIDQAHAVSEEGQKKK